MAHSLIEPGAVLDGFTIGECVHHGGMATLWIVTHPDIPAPLLMKVPRVSEGEDPAAIVSFEMEQMILPRLQGPHVPAWFATGDFVRQAYVVIERISGQTLYKRLPDLPLAYEEVRVLGGKIATALADLHRQNVVHHDIKPSSIMFRESGEAVLIDYGLSHHNHLPDLLQEEFRVPFGTAPYMAPERLNGVRTPTPLGTVLGEQGAYVIAGSFVGFLIEKYGLPDFRNLYETGAYDTVYAKSLPALEQEWRAALQ